MNESLLQIKSYLGFESYPVSRCLKSYPVLKYFKSICLRLYLVSRCLKSAVGRHCLQKIFFWPEKKTFLAVMHEQFCLLSSILPSILILNTIPIVWLVSNLHQPISSKWKYMQPNPNGKIWNRSHFTKPLKLTHVLYSCHATEMHKFTNKNLFTKCFICSGLTTENEIIVISQYSQP